MPELLKAEYFSNNHQTPTYLEFADGTWRRWTYDNTGNCLHEVHSDGAWWKYEYDDQGRVIAFADSSGCCREYTYHPDGTRTALETHPDGTWEKALQIPLMTPHYDEPSWLYYAPTFIEYSDGQWWRLEWSKAGEPLYSEKSGKGWARWERNSMQRITLHETSDGFWEKTEYDSSGILELSYENSLGEWKRWTRNDRGHLLRYEDNTGCVKVFDNDTKGGGEDTQ